MIENKRIDVYNDLVSQMKEQIMISMKSVQCKIRIGEKET